MRAKPAPARTPSPSAARPPRPAPTRRLHADRGRQIRRWRKTRLAFGLVVLVGISATLGTVVGKANHSGSGPAGITGESEPAVTTPATVVGGQPPAVTAGATPIKSENALPGSTGWRLTDPATNHEIEGYAGSTSVNKGEPITLYVSTVAPSFHVEVYRTGYYQGLGARLVQTSAELTGVHQPAPSFTPVVNMVETSWAPSLTLPTASWPPGDYLMKLVASTGAQRYVPLTVRDDASTAPIVVVNAVTTWQAYNLWGGYDLYEGQTSRRGAGSDFAHRSRTVSFDRPYALGDGAGDFLGLEYPVVSLAESLGLEVTYLTDVDLQQTVNPLLRHKAVLSLGHDEYYSLAMRHALEQARDNGVNLAFLGANALFRHIRFAPSPIGPNRHEIDYKSAREDPLNGKDNADVTVDWRERPNNNPESQLIGDFYQCNPVKADMIVVDPTNWLFAGTDATVGQRLPNVIGSEYDRYDPSVAGPPNVEILTHSPLRCHGRSDYSDATYYTAPSGAGVFASGTISWVGNINPRCQPDDCAGRVLGVVMENLFTVFSAGPAGLAHPSDPAGSTVHPLPPATTVVPTTSSESSSALGAKRPREQD